MARPLTDVTGRRYGRLVVSHLSGRDDNGRAVWHCKCDCGGTKDAQNEDLKAGRIKGCLGCLKERKSVPRGKGSDCHNYRHGGASRGAHTKEYRAWESMIRRCTMPSQYSYPMYGGKGVVVCAEWRKDFAAFLAHVGKAPSAKHTLDRHPKCDGDYEPGNVRWATPKQQANNTSANVHMELDGRKQTVGEWADELGIKYQTLWARLFVHKWPPERALRR